MTTIVEAWNEYETNVLGDVDLDDKDGQLAAFLCGAVAAFGATLEAVQRDNIPVVRRDLRELGVILGVREPLSRES